MALLINTNNSAITSPGADVCAVQNLLCRLLFLENGAAFLKQTSTKVQNNRKRLYSSAKEE